MALIQNVTVMNSTATVKAKAVNSSGGSFVDIDTALSATSENPVQNKAITGAVNGLTTRVSAVESTVGGLVSGSPIPVATVAQMVDTTKVYLYTGTESGYTAGDWYYYDGTEWVSGGKYGAASGDGLTEDIKQALLSCFANVAWANANGQTYYNALQQALYPPATLESITAVYTQSGTVYDTASLDDLKADLVVTAYYDNGTTATVTDYTLSGTLAVGTSTVTVSYGGQTATFSVTVTESTELPDGYTALEYVESPGTVGTTTAPYNTTGIKFSSTDSGEFRLGIAPTGAQDMSWGYPVGCKQQSSGNTVGFGIAVNQDMTAAGCFDGTMCEIQPLDGASFQNTKIDLVVTKTPTGESITDGTHSNSLSSTPRAMYSNFYLFGITSSQPFRGRIYYLKIYQNGTLVAHLLPAKRISDNAVGMYDLVQEAFRTDSRYIAGPEI